MKKFLIGKAVPNAASYEIQIYDASGNVAIGNPVLYTPELGADIKCDLTDKYQNDSDLIVGTEYKIKCKAKPASDEVLYVESAWSIGQPFQLYNANSLKVKLFITIEGENSLITSFNINSSMNGDIDINSPFNSSIKSPLKITFLNTNSSDSKVELEKLEGIRVSQKDDPDSLENIETFLSIDNNCLIIIPTYQIANIFESEEGLEISIPLSNFKQ